MSSVSYSGTDAFERNLGLISRQEQEKLARSLVAIAGCGGAGGLHAHTLARLGVGRFRLADPETFSIFNINRQLGANVHTLGMMKAKVTADLIKSVNPEASVEIIEEGIIALNAASFVRGSNLVVDGIEFFAMEARRRLFSAAWEARVPAVTAAPLGFSATLHVFASGGMSFDEYFDLGENQDPIEQLLNFAIGLAPANLHLAYMDLGSVNPLTGRCPSSILGCQMAACLAGAEAVRILLGRGPSFLAPHYLQFDPYRQRLRKGRLWRGNRNPLQKLKRRLLEHRLQKLGLDLASVRNTLGNEAGEKIFAGISCNQD